MLPGFGIAGFPSASQVALAFVATANGARSATSSDVVVSKPSGTADGDWMYLFIWTDANATVATVTGSWGAAVYSDVGAVSGVVIYQRRALSEPSSYTVSNATSSDLTAAIFTYSGGRGATGGVNVVGTIARASSNTSVASSITPTVAGVLFASFFTASTTNSSVPPAGMTVRGTPASSSTRARMYDLNPSSTGATGTKTQTWVGGSTPVAAIMMQIT